MYIFIYVYGRVGDREPGGGRQLVLLLLIIASTETDLQPGGARAILLVFNGNGDFQ